MMHLALLSSDPRVRAVAVAWHSLSPVARVETAMEELCRAAGISDADFIGGVIGTAWELGMDTAAFLTDRFGYSVSLRSAMGRALMTGQPVRVLVSRTACNRCRNRLLTSWARRAGDESAALRRRLRLSQSQFAGLFMTNVRTVRRWEAGLSALTTHQQWFLRLFVTYIERDGVRAFRRRFVRETPRYSRPGRPAV